MSTIPLTNEQCLEALQALAEHGTKTGAAIALNISRGAFQNRYNTAIMRGLDGEFAGLVPEGFEVKSASTQYDENGEIKGKSIKVGKGTGGQLDPTGFDVVKRSTLIDGSGNVTAQWLKEDKQKRSLDDLIGDIKIAFEDFKKPLCSTKIKSVEHTEKDLLTIYPLADLHLGLYAWGEETQEDWSLSKAIECFKKTMQRVADSSPRSETAIILGGGDLLHADTSENKTAKSGNILDVDTRYSKVLQEAIKLIVFQIELALEKHKKAIVRILPGNHDEHSALAVTHALWAWYRNEKRVNVDADPSLFFWHRFGNNLIGAAHGHTTKITEMPLVMANRCKEDWGATEHRYFHGFHIHHKTQNIFENGGVITETHQSPAPQDAYHYGRAYLSGRSMQAITYHKKNGEIIRNRVAL